MRERLYAEVAMNTAIDYGVFSSARAHTVFLPVAEKADLEQLTTFEAWGNQLNTVTRRQADKGGPGLFINVDSAIPTPRIVHGGVEGIWSHDNDNVLQMMNKQPKRKMLNRDQRRAHDIIEDQLRRQLAGNLQKP